MPGKVNPVIPEAILQVAAQVIGNDAAITLSGQAGNFELNVMLPVIAHNLLQSIQLLDKGIKVFAEKCISGITANLDKCISNLEQSLAMATAFVPAIGYDKAAALAKEAHEAGKTVRELAQQKNLMPGETSERMLDGIIDEKTKD